MSTIIEGTSSFASWEEGGQYVIGRRRGCLQIVVLVERVVLDGIVLRAAAQNEKKVHITFGAVTVDEAVCETIEILRSGRHVKVVAGHMTRITAAVLERFVRAGTFLRFDRCSPGRLNDVAALRGGFRRTVDFCRPETLSAVLGGTIDRAAIAASHRAGLLMLAGAIATSECIREVDLRPYESNVLGFDVADALVAACQKSGCIIRVGRIWGHNEVVDYFYRLVRITAKKRKVVVLHESLLEGRPRGNAIYDFLDNDGDHSLAWRITKFLVGDGV
jgi:hypothetical protein